MKGESRLAGVTVDRDVPGDPRYHHLAELLGLANHYEAIGRMVVLWSVATALRTDRPPAKKIISVLGARGPAALVEADLAELLEDGSLRVKGCIGRHEWFEDLPARGQIGGQRRASEGQRNAGGRFMPKVAGGSLAVAGTSELPANTSETDFAGPARPASPAQGLVQDPEIPASVSLVRSGASGSERSRDLVQPPGEEVIRQNQRRIGRFLELVNAARARAGTKHNVQLKPLGAAIVGRQGSELLARLRESTAPESDLEHVVAVAEAEAMEDPKTLQWLGWSLVEEKSWRLKLAAPRPGKKAAVRPALMEPKPVVFSDADRAEAGAAAAEFAAKLR